MANEITISVVPQCDSQGYESEHYAVVTIIVDGTCYDFCNVVINERREGKDIYASVFQNPDDYDGTNYDESTYYGSFVTRNCTDEAMFNLALANFLLNTSEGQQLECEVC